MLPISARWKEKYTLFYIETKFLSTPQAFSRVLMKEVWGVDDILVTFSALNVSLAFLNFEVEIAQNSK